MLDRLNAIDWAGLNAKNVPVWIMALTSSVDKERFRAAMRLLEYLCDHDAALGLVDTYKVLLSTDAPVLIAPFWLNCSQGLKLKTNIIS